MKHARSDYNRIQDPQNIIPDDEPVFLIRAQDIVSGDAVREWANLHLKAGGTTEIANAAIKHAELMDKWHTKKNADAPIKELIK